MAIRKLPAGTTGPSNPPRFVGKVLMPLMVRFHRLTGNKMQGLRLLYLTTVGAKSGQPRTVPVARFQDGDSWLIVASVGGARNHPAWYYNLVAHPDQVLVEVDGAKHQVDVEQLEGEDYERAWADVCRQGKMFAGYKTKTDRPIPILRLIPRSGTPQGTR